ncbi:MAG TPA: hypothetical protein PLZ61_05840, partial [Candidatus Cryosericum sp.]|nr:hypothetical protein [Candidatus Cryosericum sp.]
MRKFLSILIALSLVMSLFSGFVAAPKSVSAAEPAATEVKIVTPAPLTDFTPGSEYYVNAVVSNLDRVNGIAGATATLAIDGNAALVDGETATKSIDLPACGVADVWWKVKCTNPGTVKLTVTSGSGSDDVTVTQTGEVTPQGADVNVTWVETPCGTPYKGLVPVGTYFAVKALATYIPSGYAENASMTIHWTGDLELLSPATVNTGDLYAVRPEEVGWNFKCTGEGDASVWVEFNSVDVDPARVNYPKPCNFHQGPIPPPPPPPTPGSWDLYLTAPEKVCTNCAQNSFTVTAQAYNGTDSAADVYAKLVIDNPLLAAFQPGTTNPTDGESVEAESYSSEWSWDVTCLLQGPTSFTVNLYYTEDDSIPFYHESITVNQMNYMVRLGDVNELDPSTMVYAADESEYVEFDAEDLFAVTEVCDTFTVKTSFENCTCAPMGNGVDEFVYAKVNLPATVKLTGDITVEEWARVPSGPLGEPDYEPYGATALKDSYTVPASAVVDGWLPLPTNCACCYFVITWKLACIGSDAGAPNEVSFEAYRDVRGTKTLLDSTGFGLLQESAPHIQTGIDYLPGLYGNSTLGTSSIGVIAAPCEQEDIGASNAFTVVIPVSNTGDVAAANVVLTAALTGDYTNAQYAILENGTLSGWAAFTSEQAITLGTVNGHTAEKILIQASCSGPEDVLAHIVSVTGTDALTDIAIDSTNGAEDNPTDSCGNHYVCFAADETLVQIPLSFTIVEPDGDQEFYVSSNYAVKVIVTNCSTVDTEVLHGLQASLDIDGQAEFNNDTATHLLGDLAPGNSAETSWNVHCTGASGLFADKLAASAAQQPEESGSLGSPTEFTVTLTGSDPVLAMTRSVTVLQMPTSQIDITISSPQLIPGDSDQWLEYATGQKFALTAWVYNAGPLPAENVTISVFSSIDRLGVPAFQVVDDPNTNAEFVNIGTLAAREGKFETWTMQAVR